MLNKRGDDGKDQVAALNSRCEDDELPNEPTGRWQTAEGDHEDEEPCSDEWGALAHTNVFLHVGGSAGDLDVGGCDEGTDVGKGVGCYVEADGDDAEGVRCCDGEEQMNRPARWRVCEHTLDIALWDSDEVPEDDGEHRESGSHQARNRRSS